MGFKCLREIVPLILNTYLFCSRNLLWKVIRDSLFHYYAFLKVVTQPSHGIMHLVKNIFKTVQFVPHINC